MSFLRTSMTSALLSATITIVLPAMSRLEGSSSLGTELRMAPPIWYSPDSLAGLRPAKWWLLVGLVEYEGEVNQRGRQNCPFQQPSISHRRRRKCYQERTDGLISLLFSSAPGKSGTTTSHSYLREVSEVAIVRN